MREVSPSDKMQLRGIGDLMHPGCCASCGSGVCEFGYVDLGIYYDYEGQMYLCATCMEQAGETIGMLTKRESDHLLAVSQDLATENTLLKDSYNNALDRLAKYDSLLLDALGTSPSDSASLDDGDHAQDVSEPEPAGDTITPDVTVESDFGESEFEESVTVTGRNDSPRTKRGNRKSSEPIEL